MENPKIKSLGYRLPGQIVLNSYFSISPEVIITERNIKASIKMVIVKWILIFTVVIAGWLPARSQPSDKIVINRDIQLIPLGDSLYIHETWDELEGYGRFSSNGLVLIKGGRALMVDTPMDNEKTRRLTSYITDSLKATVTKLIIGHFHDDCLGGLGYLQSIGVEAVAHSMTIRICREQGLPIPQTPFSDALNFDFNGEEIECRYFGAGHSADNITVWLPGRKVLFGGCLIKSMDSTGLGNLSDAVVADWDTTVGKLLKQYSGIQTVVPGHGSAGGAELLPQTIQLVEKQRMK